MVDKKLANVGEGTNPADAITLKQLDAVDFEAITRDVDLQDTYNVINIKQQTFNEMNTNRNTLVCYEDVRDVFVGHKESVFPMETHLNMANNYSGAPARAKRARSGAPRVRKFGKLSIRENLVMT